MNAERLHAITAALKYELTTLELPTLARQLAGAVNTAASQPGVEAPQTEVSQYREQLAERLHSAASNEFSDAWRQHLEELGVTNLLGDALLARVEETLERNAMTPAVAATDLGSLADELDALNNALDQTLAGFKYFGIGADELAPGEFEVGFLIPRHAVDNELEHLGKEFEELDSILVPFMELVGAGRPDIAVRSISSSDFQVFLNAIPGFAQLMAQIVESLLSSYEKIRNIRAKAGTLKDEDEVPEEAAQPLIDYANEKMWIDVEALAEQLVEQAGEHVPGGRGFEMRVEVRRSLRQLAKRIDDGYSIEVRAFRPPEDEAEMPDGVSPDAIEIAKAITARQPAMRTMNLTGKPILQLPEGDGEAEADHPDDEDDSDAPVEDQS